MNWPQRRMTYLVLLAVVVLVLSLIVLVRNRSLETDLLAACAIVGGLAIIVVALPSDGKQHD
jgi:hypothetical protein